MYHINKDEEITEIDISKARADFEDMARSAMRDIGLTEDEAERELEDYNYFE
jgi:uncharacterized protein YjiS (DUF1127 family)